MKDVIVLGTGGESINIAQMIERINAEEPTWKLLGFLATDYAEPKDEIDGYPVLGTEKDLAQHTECSLVYPNEWGWPKDLKPPVERLATVVDPSCFVSHSAEIGQGCVLFPHCFIGSNVRLGSSVYCRSHVVIDHNCVLGDDIYLASNVSLAGYVRVRSHSLLGQGSTVRQGVTVHEGSLLGMGAVVIRDVPPDSIMAGNPAERLRSRGDTPF